jgi:hypothetical protein
MPFAHPVPLRMTSRKSGLVAQPRAAAQSADRDPGSASVRSAVDPSMPRHRQAGFDSLGNLPRLDGAAGIVETSPESCGAVVPALLFRVRLLAVRVVEAGVLRRATEPTHGSGLDSRVGTTGPGWRTVTVAAAICVHSAVAGAAYVGGSDRGRAAVARSTTRAVAVGKALVVRADVAVRVVRTRGTATAVLAAIAVRVPRAVAEVQRRRAGWDLLAHRSGPIARAHRRDRAMQRGHLLPSAAAPARCGRGRPGRRAPGCAAVDGHTRSAPGDECDRQEKARPAHEAIVPGLGAERACRGLVTTTRKSRDRS